MNDLSIRKLFSGTAAPGAVPVQVAAETLCPVLEQTNERNYCLYAQETRHCEIWWYFNGLAPYRGFSRPFADRSGRWWFCVKPRFAWPVNFFERVASPPRSAALSSLFGRQWPEFDEARVNSQVWMNVIHDLAGYGIERVDPDKRRAVRKGQKNLSIVRIKPDDPAVHQEACEVWNSHVIRTGWNATMRPAQFGQSWSELAAWPGTTVLATRDKQSGVMCGWLIARVIDDVVYVDTIASHTERLSNRPNDVIIFECLAQAARQGIRRAHYSLRSNIAPLEAFKQSLGFVPYAFPARLQLRWPVGPLMRLFAKSMYKRLRGDTDWADAEPAKREEAKSDAAENPGK